MNIALTTTKAIQYFQLLRHAVTITVAILITKTHLSTEQIGGYEQLFYLSYLFTFFWVSGLLQGLLSIYPKQSEQEQGQFHTVAYLTFLGLSVLVFGIMYLGEKQVLYALTGKTHLAHYHLVLVYLLLNIPTYLVENLYLLNDRPRQIVSFGLFSFIGHLIAILLPLFLGYSLAYSFYALIALALLKHLWLLWELWQNGVFTINITLLQQWLWLSFPLIAYSFVAGLTQSFDSWIVNHHYQGDERTFAIFRYGAREFPLVIAMANAFNAAMLPQVAKDLTTSMQAIRLKSVKLFHLLYPLSIVAMLSSAFMFPLVFGDDYLKSALVFNIYLLLLLSRLIFSRTILIGLQANTFVFIVSIIELITNIILSFVLIKKWGLAGAAIATVVGMYIEQLLFCGYLYFKKGISFTQFVNLKWYVFYSALLVIAFIASLPFFRV